MKATLTDDRGMYAGLLIASVFLVFAALGPGVFGNASYHTLSWQHFLFDPLCHQDPQRSFYLNGSQMAVCARCLGIYGSFAVGVLVLPLSDYLFDSTRKTMFRLAGLAVMVNFFDVAGNFFGFWENTLNSRFLLGCLLGLGAALTLSNTFFNKTKKQTGVT